MAKIKTIWVLIVFIIVVLGLKTFKDVTKLLAAFEKIQEVKQEILRLEKENKEMISKKDYFLSEQFIEEEARNKLNMAKPGEIIVILPPDFQKELEHKKENFLENSSLPNWKKWWQLFF